MTGSRIRDLLATMWNAAPMVRVTIVRLRVGTMTASLMVRAMTDLPVVVGMTVSRIRDLLATM
jgi:hypothetical protein